MLLKGAASVAAEGGEQEDLGVVCACAIVVQNQGLCTNGNGSLIAMSLNKLAASARRRICGLDAKVKM